MSKSLILTAQNISKVYDLAVQNTKGTTHRFLKALTSRKPTKEFWALKDVSFTLEKGDSLALVGKNGSGKSTLLQILCGIVRPTTGSVSITGRMSAILELSTGFNPEYTGRENVYFKSILHGLSQKAARENFERIVEFAEIGEFIDQPVKTYSSGMYARLAFSVCINVQADIVIVDEALSVGDFIFKEKCFAYLRNLRQQGTTIILVTHNHKDARDHCNKAIWLNRGKIQNSGPASTVVDSYIEFYTRDQGLEATPPLKDVTCLSL